MRVVYEAGDVRRAAGADANLADIHNRIGAYGEAEIALRAAVQTCRRVGHRAQEAAALCNLGYALTMSGRAMEARGVLDEAAALASGIGHSKLALVAAVYRVRALLAAGATDEAGAEAEAAVRESERLAAPGLSVLALTAAARTRLAANDPARALAHSGRALELRDALGGVEEDEADVYWTHARGLAEAGEHARAAEIRSRGRDRLWQLARKIGDLEMRARFLRDIPVHRALVEADDL